jgi:DNA-binding NtrC family response regulator
MDTIKVLIVDDEQGFREPLAKRLRRRDLEVSVAAGGQEALDVLGVFPADVVLLDVKMPGMSGFETLHRIKSEFPLVEVILLTGHADLDASVQCLRHGAFDYLLKPADMDTLFFKIQDAYTTGALRRPTTAADNGGSPDDSEVDA